MRPFSRQTLPENQTKYIQEAILNEKLSGGHDFADKCQSWMEKLTGSPKVFLTSSCTHALEMAAILLDVKPGDEIIMPSYTFPSTANAFVLRGAKIVFVDIRPDTMNIDETLIDEAITERTKAIVPVHYAGVSCEMDSIMDIAEIHNLYVVEDTAQGIMSTYKGRALGAIGHLGVYSFHETKNYTCGEGGAILINKEKFIKRAEIISAKGTNRSQFLRGEVDSYSWQDIGGSFLTSELNAAFLFAQLEKAEQINEERLTLWDAYQQNLKPLADRGIIDLPAIPENCTHNAHIYYLKVKNAEERSTLLEYLKENNICAQFHYIPLHTSKAGKRFGRFYGVDKYTTRESQKLVRLPLYNGMSQAVLDEVCNRLEDYFKLS